MNGWKKGAVDYHQATTPNMSFGVQMLHLVLHLSLTLFPLIVTFLPKREDLQLSVMFIGSGVGGGISYYLFRESRFRQWAKILFGFYGFCVGLTLFCAATEFVFRSTKN